MINPLRRILHRNEDYDDIRTHVLGERFEEPDRFEKPAPPQDEDFSQRTRDVFQPFPTSETQSGPAPFSPAPAPSRDYDILDRLTMIENQLAVVRSQTETINERLKNLDAKLGTRRY